MLLTHTAAFYPTGEQRQLLNAIISITAFGKDKILDRPNAELYGRQRTLLQHCQAAPVVPNQPDRAAQSRREQPYSHASQPRRSLELPAV